MIDEMTIGEAKQLAKMFCSDGGKEHHPLIGKKVFIRTVTYHYTGLLVRDIAGTYELKDAAWIACSKRFADTLSRGDLDEVEPYPDGTPCYVQKMAVVDMTEWAHDLPRKQQ